MGADPVFAVDLNATKLALAERLGAVPVNARVADPVQEIVRLTGGRGVDASLELIGSARTMEQAVEVLAVRWARRARWPHRSANVHRAVPRSPE